MPRHKGIHEELYERAKEAITYLYSDTTVDPGTTKETLKGLRDEIDILLDTLD